MKQVSKILLFIFSVILLISCKKDQLRDASNPAEESSVEKLKFFYNSQLVGRQQNARETETLADHMIDSVEWDRTAYFDNEKLYLVPVYMPVSRYNKLYIMYKFLVIQDQGEMLTGYFDYTVVKKDHYTGEFTERDAMYSIILNIREGASAETASNNVQHIKYSLDYREALNSGREEHYLRFERSDGHTNLLGTPHSNFAPVANCEAAGGTVITIDWYYQVYQGAVLIYEEYLYSTQECWGIGGGGVGGGGGTTTNACEQQAANFINAGHVSNEIVSSIEEENLGTIKTDRHVWKIFDAFTWKIYSCDKIKWYRPNMYTAYTYYGYEHVYTSESGTSIGGTRSYAILGQPTCTSYISSAVVQIDFSVTHKPDCYNTIPLPGITNIHSANKKFIPHGITIIGY